MFMFVNIHVPRADPDAEWLFCVCCVAPHIHENCDGSQRKTYKRCPHHPADCDEDYPQRRMQYDKYDHIRAERDDETHALDMWAVGHGAHPFVMYRGQDSPALEVKEAAIEVFRRIRVTRGHVGCVHSDEPKVIVCAAKKDTRSFNTRYSKESPLASGLYFRHCDGTYKNLKGEKLCTGGK